MEENKQQTRPIHSSYLILHTSSERGYILLSALAFVGILILGAGGLFGYTTEYARYERGAIANSQALALAEAGIDKAIYELNQNANYTGETGTALGAGTISISIASDGSSGKRITAIGYVPSSANPRATRTVKATANINTSVVSFRFGVQVGEGGISMNNGSRITGNVFSNGSVSGSGDITGDVTVAAATASSPNQSWTVQTGDLHVADTADRAYVAQSFRPTSGATLNRVSLLLKKTGTPGDANVRVVTDAGGSPSTSVLVNGVVSASWITASYAYADVALDALATLSANQTYWIVVSGNVSDTDHYIWGLDGAGGYGNGAAKTSVDWNASSTWLPVAGDLDFKIYLGSGTTTISGVEVEGDAAAQRLSNCEVGGDAFYREISSCSVGGVSHPGSTPAVPGSMPISDGQIDAWEATALSGGTIAGPYTITNTQTLGPKKINGNLTVTGTLILSGPVWVNGNITFANNADLTVAPGIGANGAIMIADSPGNESGQGTVTFANNVLVSGNGTAGSFPMVISTNTSGSAMTLSNNSDGVIMYASRGTIALSNNASANQITAYRLQLSNNADVTYLSGLQNASFTNGPGGSWAIVPGSYVIVN